MAELGVVAGNEMAVDSGVASGTANPVAHEMHR